MLTEMATACNEQPKRDGSGGAQACIVPIAAYHELGPVGAAFVHAVSGRSDASVRMVGMKETQVLLRSVVVTAIPRPLSRSKHATGDALHRDVLTIIWRFVFDTVALGGQVQQQQQQQQAARAAVATSSASAATAGVSAPVDVLSALQMFEGLSIVPVFAIADQEQATGTVSRTARRVIRTTAFQVGSSCALCHHGTTFEDATRGPVPLCSGALNCLNANWIDVALSLIHI